MRITPEIAEQAYSILVEECGASDDQWERTRFVKTVSEEDRTAIEYRFHGALGFGGKFRQDRGLDGQPRVTCYPEHLTVERSLMMERANGRLKSLLNGHA